MAESVQVETVEQISEWKRKAKALDWLEVECRGLVTQGLMPWYKKMVMDTKGQWFAAETLLCAVEKATEGGR